MAAPVSQAMFQVIAAHPSYLYAMLMPLWGGISLSVYRSPVLDVSDNAYLPVRNYLNRHDHDLAWQKTVADESMMFGEAQHSIYVIKEKLWQN